MWITLLSRQFGSGTKLRPIPFVSRYLCNMTEETENTNRLKFDRVNAQLNYKRKFIPKHKAEVTIPTMSYEGIDLYSPETRVKPWSLLELLISSRVFTQWPAKKASSPQDSFLDVHKLLSVPGQAIYFAGVQIDISRDFHDHTSPKHPLVVEQELLYVGNSSARKQYVLKHQESQRSFVRCYFDDVLIRKSNGKGIPFPGWWREKYSFVNEFNEKPAVVKMGDMNGREVFEDSYKVEYDDLDHNLHATSSSYLRFCFNAAFANIDRLPSGITKQSNNEMASRTDYGNAKHLKYKNITLDIFNAGVKSVVMQFSRETRFGDEILVKSWEDSESANTLQFVILKNKKEICCYVKVQFFDTTRGILSSQL